MKIFKLIYILFFGILSCGQELASNANKSLVEPLAITSEQWTLYNMQDSLVHVQRLMSSDSGLTLLSYDINISRTEAAVQTFISRKQKIDSSEAELLRLQNSKLSWKPYQDTLTLFVQIDGAAFKDDMEELLTRQAVEKEIGDALKNEKLGEWVAGDLGPGGANMLFEVNDINKSVSIILSALKTSGFNKNIRIGRSIGFDAENWFYEVIYPINFNGRFNTM